MVKRSNEKYNIKHSGTTPTFRGKKIKVSSDEYYSSDIMLRFRNEQIGSKYQ